jgi:hypothetical protein
MHNVSLLLLDEYICVFAIKYSCRILLECVILDNRIQLLYIHVYAQLCVHTPLQLYM